MRRARSPGHDLDSLLFNFLDEFLFVFSTELIVSKEVEIVEFDRENFKIRAVGRGEPFDLEKHPQGTEVKVRPTALLLATDCCRVCVCACVCCVF